MNDGHSILIVEDEESLGKTLTEYLQDIGHHCFWAQDAKQARALFMSHKPSIVLMDITLPDGNGIELAHEFKQTNKNFVLFFLSALNDPDTKLQGLELGGLDYITKPFALKELRLRLERTLNSQIEKTLIPDELKFGKLIIWFKKFEVQNGNGEIIALSQKECAILQILYLNRGEAVARAKIISEIWGEDKFPSNRTVDNYIVTLRKWADSDPEAGLEIKSIRSIGYKLNITKQ